MNCIKCQAPADKTFCSDCLASAKVLANPVADEARIAAETPTVSSKHSRWVEGVRSSPSLTQSGRVKAKQRKRRRRPRR